MWLGVQREIIASNNPESLIRFSHSNRLGAVVIHSAAIHVIRSLLVWPTLHNDHQIRVPLLSEDWVDSQTCQYSSSLQQEFLS